MISASEPAAPPRMHGAGTPRTDSPEFRANAALMILLTAALLACGGLWLVSDDPPPIAMTDIALKIDPNTASSAELELLPGIGPAIAENIIAYRELHPSDAAFIGVADLDAVSRIGPKTIERMRPTVALPE